MITPQRRLNLSL